MAQERFQYIDGIRGIAILLVFLAHLSAGVFPHDIRFSEHFSFFEGGGFVGVQLFFALSGYLITKNLLSEHNRFGNIRFKLFYLRRLWRLYPVLILACVAYFVYAFITMERRILPAVAGDVFMALTYTTNLPIYPERFPDLGWMSHTWSLSVEEQFYLFWPLLLFLLLKTDNVRIRFIIPLGILLLQFLVRAVADPGLHYTLLRWDALMAGCILNFIKIPASRYGALLSGAVIAFYAWRHPEPIANHDYLVTSVACGLFISQARELRLVSHPVLVYFGKTSYSLYLWHFFIMRMGYPGYFNLSASLVLSDLSYRYFEAPLLSWARTKYQLTR